MQLSKKLSSVQQIQAYIRELNEGLNALARNRRVSE